MTLRATAIGVVAAVAGACAGTGPAVPGLTWDRQPGSLALQRNGVDVWRFQHGPERSKPCFHPLALPAGVLTVDQPADHRWHHGLWFSWKLIDGVNYWEHEGATGRPAGTTAWEVVGLETRADGRARIALRVQYRPGDAAPVLTEERVLAVSAPDRDGAFAIDWQATFAARRDCVLDRTPLPGEPGGRVFGGYAGLSLRLGNLAERAAVTLDGPVEWNRDERCRTRSAAMDYSGLLADQPVGIAILDHPDNRNAPSPWYAIRSAAMTFFTPAVIAPGPLRLARDERLDLRYRVCVHPGRWTAADLAAAHAAWLQGRPFPDHRTP